MLEAKRYLFLDRDGTINRRIVDGYVMCIEEFEFLPGALEAIFKCSDLFERIFIVTNQQGIGKEIMTHEELNEVHQYMVDEINNANGRIDQIYYCPTLAIHDPLCRKPQPGMAMQAQSDFPEVDFEDSIMIGDMPSDIEFGNRLGMETVLLCDKAGIDGVKPDYVYNDLLSFVVAYQRSLSANV